MSRPRPRLSWHSLWILLFAWLFSLPALGASLKPDKAEIGVGETVFVKLDADLALMVDWSASPELTILNSNDKGATVKGEKAGKGKVTVKYLGGKKSTMINVSNVAASKDSPEDDKEAVRMEGMARAMGMPDLDVRIARLLYEVNTGKRSPKRFYEGLRDAGAKMTDVIRVRKVLVDHPDQSFTRQIMGPTFSENGTPVEKTLLTWRRDQTKAAIDEVVKQFIDAGRIPANGFELIISHVGKWANQTDNSLTFTGDIDFSFVSNDTALAEAMKESYLKAIQRRTGLDQVAIDSVCTAHGKAGLEVYIGRHGMAFAEEQMKINEVVDMTTGARTKIDGDGAAMRVGAILTIERGLADAAGVETKQPVLNTEPGLSMEMARHFQHDIVDPKIFDLNNAVVKAAKYLDRSYKALDKAGGQPSDARLADFARQLTELANAEPQTKEVRDNMIRRISDYLGSPPQTVWDMGTNKLVLTIDHAAVDRFHQDAGKALKETVRQGSNARTNELDGRLRDLLERQRKGDKVDEDVAKLRQEMVDMVDMVEAEIKAAHGMDIPTEVHTNNAKVRAMLDTLSKRFGVKALSAEELKDKKFVEELLKAEAQHHDEGRLKMIAGYVMDRTARAAELSMSGVEKTNQLLDIIDDRLLGPLRGDSDFATFEAEMKLVRQASLDPRLRSDATGRLSVLKTNVAMAIKGTNIYLNDKLQATAAGRQGMKFMMVYGLVDEMQAYRDAFNERGWGGFATEIFKRRIPLGGAVESAVMGNTLRAGWDVVTTLIPPLGLPEAAYGLGTMIGTQVKSTYWSEQLAVFTDGLYADAIFKVEEEQRYEKAKVNVYRLVRTFHNNMPLDLHRFAEMRKDQVDALGKEVETGHVNWQAYKNNFNGLTEWLDVDATLKANLAASDPALMLLEEMANHEAVGPKLMDRLAEKGLARWEQVKLGYVVKLIKHLEDRKQADDALGRGALPELFAELRKVAADLGIEDEVMKGLDAEVDTSNMKKLVNWLWDTKRAALGQPPTESETTRAAQVVKKYLDAYKQVQSLRDQAAGSLAKTAVDVNTRYLTTSLFLAGRAETDLAAARAWIGQIETARKAMSAALLAIKRTFLPKAGLDSADQPYLDRALAHEVWIKPYQDGNARLQKAWMKDYANGHVKERDKILAEYKDWLTKLGPVQLTVTAADAKDAKKKVSGLNIALVPTDELGKPVSAGAPGNQVVMGVPMGRYTLTASAPGYFDASRSVVYGRGLTATPSENIALAPTGKDPDKDKTDGKDGVDATGIAAGGKTGADKPGPAKQGAGGSASGQFPGEPFNGMQISYSFSGCSLPEMTDKPGFTTSRGYKGRLGSGTMTVSGTARMGAGYGATLSVSVNAGGEHKEYSTYIKSGWPGFNNASFNLTIPIPASATGGGFGIRMDGEYNAGGRGLVVSGSCSADGPEGEAPKGTSELSVDLTGPSTPVPLGKEAEVSASAKGGRFPYSYAWTGASGENERAKAKIVRPGSQQVAVTVSDSEGKRAGANLTIKVAPLKLELAGLPGQAYYGGRSRLQVNGLPDFQPPADPCAGRQYTGHNPYDECATVKVDAIKSVSVAPQWDDANKPPPITTNASPPARANREAREGAYRFVWQSEPGLAFEPPTSTDGATWVTYDRMGQVKVWCEVHQMIEGAWQTIGETDQKTVNVVAPAFSLNFNPPDGQGRVGQDVRATVVAKPEVPAKLIDYRWFDPASGNRMEYTENAGEIGFKVKDAKPMKLEALARVPHYGDEIARITGSYTGVAYDVKISPPKARGPQLQVWVCDTQLGNAKNCGMKGIPQGQFSTFQDIFLSAQVTPAPPSPRYRWTVDPSGSCGLPGAGGELRLNCSSTGSYTVRLQVTDADNLLLGQAEAGVSVSVSDNDVKQAPKSKEAYDKMQQARQQANDGQLDEAINLAGTAAVLDPKNTEAKDLGKRWNDEQKTVQQQIDRARKALQANKPDDAQKEIDAAKKLHPKYPPVLDAEKQLADKRKTQGQTATGKTPAETATTPPAVGAAQAISLAGVGGQKGTPRVVKGVAVDDSSWIRFKSTDENRRSLDVPVPTPTRAAAVAIVSNLDDATYLEQGKTIARLIVSKDTGDEALDIQAGVHTSEWNYGVGPKHKRVDGADIGDNRFLAVLPLTRPGVVKAIRVEYVESNAPKWSGHAPGFCLRGISLVSDTRGLALTPAGAGAIASTPAESHAPPSQISGNGRMVLEDDAGPYTWIDATEVQTRKVHAGRAAFLSNGNDHFTHRLGLVGNYAGQYRYLDFWIYLDQPGADIQIQVQVDGVWGKRWGFDGDSRYNGFDWAMEGTTVNLPSGRWLHQRLDLIDQLHIHAGQAITGLAFSSDNADVYYDSVYLLPSPAPLPPPAVNPGGKRVLEDDAGPYPWIDATTVQKEVVAYGQAAFRSNGNDHFTADLGVAGDYPEQFRSLSFWVFPIGAGADMQLQVQVDGVWGKRWGYEAGPKYDGYDGAMEGTTTGLKPGVWQELKIDLVRDLHINPGQRITGLAFSSDGGDVYYDSVYLQPNPSPAVKPSFQPVGKRVLEDDAGGYRWVEATEVQGWLVFNGSRAFRSTGNNHFVADLGVAGNGAGQYRAVGFWAFFMGPAADIQLQVQVNGEWGKRWGYEAGPKYDGYGWAMEGTTANLPSGRWTWIRADLIDQLRLKSGDRITGLAFSSDNGDVAYDSVYLLPAGAAPGIGQGSAGGAPSAAVPVPGGRDYTSPAVVAGSGGPETTFQGHRYRAIPVPGGITWDEADRAARSLGGHLAVITSAAENDAVYSLLRNDDRYWFQDSYRNGIGPWLGGLQPPGSAEPRGGWRWVTGEAFDYANWAVNQPDNGWNVEDRLQLFGHQTLKSPAWNDIAAGNKVNGYIVEFGEPGQAAPGGRSHTGRDTTAAAPAQGRLIFEIGNIGGTSNGPTKASRFTLDAPHMITLIRDYHWNSAQGASPGSIALKGQGGGSHGPWRATGSPGQGGVPNAYWTAYPNIILPTGTYTVVDSDPASWSHNAESNNRGFVRVEGYPVDSGQPSALPSTGNAQIDGAMKEVDGLLDAVKSLKGLFGK